MATRVFFLNSDAAQYGEEEMNHVQKFLFEEGVLNTLGSDWNDWIPNGDLKVTERGAGANMSVDVAPGWAIIETLRNGVTFKVFAQNLAVANLAVAANATGNDRVDAVIMRVSRTAEPNVLTNNVVTLEVVTGNGTDAMTDEEIATIIDSEDDFIRLADITVPDSTADITDGDITDTRVRCVTSDSFTYSPTLLRFRTLYDDPSESDIQEGDVWFNSQEGVLKFYNGADIIALEPSSFIAGDGIDITDGVISATEKALNPTGVIQVFAGASGSVPAGWLLCDGSAVSRTTYADLFALLSTTYGAGNGSTTFNLPNLKGKVPVGLDSAQTEFDTLAETGGSKTNNHTHGAGSYVSTSSNNGNGWGGAYWGGNSIAQYNISGTSATPSDTNNLQPYIVMHYIIKT